MPRPTGPAGQIGPTALKTFLIVASRNARGLPTTLILLAKLTGTNKTNCRQTILRLIRRGLLERDGRGRGTVRPTASFALEFTQGVPPCLQSLIGELRSSISRNGPGQSPGLSSSKCDESRPVTGSPRSSRSNHSGAADSVSKKSGVGPTAAFPATGRSSASPGPQAGRIPANAGDTTGITTANTSRP